MATKTRAARVIQFAEIERRFELVPLRITYPPSPAVSYKDGEGYSVRVLVYSSSSAYGRTTERFDYFRLDAEGNIAAAPRGYAKDYRPGRIPVEELDAAVARYAEAVSGG